MMFLASLACNLMLCLTASAVLQRRPLLLSTIWFLGWGALLSIALFASSLPAVTSCFLLLSLLLLIAIPQKWSRKAFLRGCGATVIVAYCGSLWIYLPKFAEHQRLLARFPEVDLSSRLNYEQPGAMQEFAFPDVNKLERDYAATLASSTAKRKRLAFQGLLEMHENYVLDFIAQPGLGVGRMNGYDVVREATFDLKAGTPEESIAVPPLIRQRSPTSSQSGPGSRRRNDQNDELAARLSSQSTPPVASFTGDELSQFEMVNRQAVVRFVPALSLGGVGSQQTARGFQSHAFQQEINNVHLKGNSNSWYLSRLELVSLWKHSTPMVYVSEHLPAMVELREVPKRPLSAFEAQAIHQLRDGEEIVTAIDSNELRMVGAIRAIEDCRACHRVGIGGLLGAFSYRFR